LLTDLKNFTRTLKSNLIRDQGYFIPVETGLYSFRVAGSGANPFGQTLLLFKDSLEIERNSSMQTINMA
jgi:hypothetical protein